MTYDDAKKAAIASGIPEADLTADDIRLFGYEVGDPTAGLNPVVAVTDAQVKDDIALAMKESEGNALLPNILKRLGPLALKAVSSGILIFVLLMSCSGCSTTRAKALVDQSEKSVAALNDEHLKFEEVFIQDFRAKELERIERLYNDAIKSHTVNIPVPQVENVKVRTIGADGKVTETTETQKTVATQEFIKPEVADALLKRKIDLFAQLETNTNKWRQKQAIIAKNAANAAKYSEALRAYFDQKAVDFDNLTTVSNQMFSFLETFIKGKPKPAAGE